MGKQTAPKIELPGLDLSSNAYIVNDNTYDISTLIQYCKEKEYPVFDMPLAGILLENLPFECENFLSFCNHVKRIENASLQYPIIIDALGYVADGWHRIAKAIINGETTIKAVRIMKMPQPSGKTEKDE